MSELEQDSSTWRQTDTHLYIQTQSLHRLVLLIRAVIWDDWTCVNLVPGSCTKAGETYNTFLY